MKIIRELLYPRRCPVCDRATVLGTMICPACETSLRVIKGPVCYKCGKHLDADEKEYCDDCTKHKHIFVEGRALYEYTSVNSSIYRFKYNNRSEYAEYFGRQMAMHFRRQIDTWNADLIIPVPLHKSRYKKRGYNQSALLAKVMAKELKIPYSDKIIYRKKKTVPMKELGAIERQSNLKNAFIVGDNDVKLKTIVIVDDIYTTGSTLDAISLELLRCGAKKVYFVTLAIGRGL